MTKAITTNKEEGYEKLAKVVAYTVEELKVMHTSVAEGTTLTEFMYFLNVAKAQELNPFTKEIWCYKDGKGNLIIFASRDGFLKKAQKNPAYNGIRSCEICENDEFEIDVANNKIKHKIVDLKNRGAITGAYCIAFRRDGEPTIELVELAIYKKENKYTPWTTHTAEMIKKVAEVHALKKAFGISGIQTEEDFDIKEGKALPLSLKEAPEKRKLDDKAFKKLLKNSDKFILKHKESFEFTESQAQELDNRFKK